MTQAQARGGNAFLNKETIGGLILVAAAAMALIVSNSPLAAGYRAFLDLPIAVSIGPLALDKPLVLWVNDGLMAIFFFLVGLEIKREVMVGELSSRDRAALPLIAAIGGMAVPALIFVMVNSGNPANMAGWAIPSATDIAFALGLLTLLGPVVPTALKVFLLGIAIIDDLGAIIAIALFYTEDLSPLSLGLGAVGFLVLLAMNRLGITRIGIYALVGTFVWTAVLKSGVHATLAGVLVALTVPLRDAEDAPVLNRVEHQLHPWVAYFIMPVFAFANAGVPLAGLSMEQVLAPLPLGIALGLFVGKQIGVMSFSWLGVRLGLCRLPANTGWKEVYGIACLTGIGFTMSLFIGTLAFDPSEQLNAVRVGVLIASSLSAVVGMIVLRRILVTPTEMPRGALTDIRN